MVKVPVPTTFATELPEIEPNSALESTATWAGPPTQPPVSELARSMKNAPAPDFWRKAPNIMYGKM